MLENNILTLAVWAFHCKFNYLGLAFCSWNVWPKISYRLKLVCNRLLSMWPAWDFFKKFGKIYSNHQFSLSFSVKYLLAVWWCDHIVHWFDLSFCDEIALGLDFDLNRDQINFKSKFEAGFLIVAPKSIKICPKYIEKIEIDRFYIKIVLN